jgi:hypothetical protein
LPENTTFYRKFKFLRLMISYKEIYCCGITWAMLYCYIINKENDSNIKPITKCKD